MDSRRRFTTRQRAALFVAADGTCQRCGRELEPGWHGDHEKPHSKGGATEVENGQALCPTCNLKKGDSMATSGLREWQEQAYTQFCDSNQPNFLAVATPGAGKTTFALTCMAGATDDMFHIVVVPTSRLRVQWADAADKFGIYLDPRFDNAQGVPAPDVDGIVVTYQAVASLPDIYRRLAARRQTFVVLDEVHHCGDELSWGDSIQHAFEPATRRLLLSGTPFRGDNNQIPFVTYRGEPPTSDPDYSYGYEPALQDGVVRAVEFAGYDGTARWTDAGDVTESLLSEANGIDEGRALASALVPDGEWMSSILNEAHGTLARVRADVHDAGGLIVANTQHHARSLAAKMSRICGRAVPCAVSDDPNARQVIENFTKSTDPWLVAVNMVSEGVDIPRLLVGVYATNSRTEVFFRQVVGRFVRVRGDESDSHTATVFIPHVPTLLELARNIEAERNHALAEPIESTKKPSDDQQVFDLVEPLPALDARHLRTILGGDDLSPEELERAMEAMRQAGISGGVTAAQIARLLRVAGAGRVVGRATVKQPERPTHREAEQVRNDVNRLVKKVAYQTGMQHGDVWIRVHNHVGETSIKNATVDSLHARRAFLLRWIESL